MEPIYPWFQDYNMGDPWVIGCLFHHMTVKEMKLVSGKILDEENLEREVDTKWRKKMMALELIVPILS